MTCYPTIGTVSPAALMYENIIWIASFEHVEASQS